MTLWRLLVVHAQIMGVITLACIILLASIDLLGTLAGRFRGHPRLNDLRQHRLRPSAAASSVRTNPARSFAHLLR